jgi:4-alpha-glucanotransferase
LKGDLPILVNEGSVDVWEFPDEFSKEYVIGAPPDPIAPKGLSWGLPLYLWDVAEKNGYAWWKRRIAVANRLYSLCRLDHVLGFFRFWSIPKGNQGNRGGGYVPSTQANWVIQGKNRLQAILSDATFLPIAENLGTTTPEIDQSLIDLGICITNVPRWKKKTSGFFVHPSEYELLSITSISTHDTETLEGWWKLNPIEAKRWASACLSVEYSVDLSVDIRRKILEIIHGSRSMFVSNLLSEYLSLKPEFVWENPSQERLNIPGCMGPASWTYRMKKDFGIISCDYKLKHMVRNILEGSLPKVER